MEFNEWHNGTYGIAAAEEGSMGMNDCDESEGAVSPSAKSQSAPSISSPHSSVPRQPMAGHGGPAAPTASPSRPPGDGQGRSPSKGASSPSSKPPAVRRAAVAPGLLSTPHDEADAGAGRGTYRNSGAGSLVQYCTCAIAKAKCVNPGINMLIPAPNLQVTQMHWSSIKPSNCCCRRQPTSCIGPEV